MIGEFFDPKSEVLTAERCRPHWSQAGAVVFITFRTLDSIPRAVLERWDNEKQAWVRAKGCPDTLHWSQFVATLADTDRAEFQRTFQRQRELTLDECHGRCPFRRPAIARIVADSLLHFDGDRYRMGDFVVMPNHVHLLAAFPTAEGMKRQCGSWMHFTAVQVNKVLGEKGHFWQREPFDHLVRSPEQYAFLREYIAENPVKAKLKPGEYLHRRLEG